MINDTLFALIIGSVYVGIAAIEGAPIWFAGPLFGITYMLTLIYVKKGK